MWVRICTLAFGTVVSGVEDFASLLGGDRGFERSGGGPQGGRALWALTFYNPNLGLPTRERRPMERLLVGALSNILVFLGEERE